MSPEAPTGFDFIRSQLTPTQADRLRLNQRVLQGMLEMHEVTPEDAVDFERALEERQQEITTDPRAQWEQRIRFGLLGRDREFMNRLGQPAPQLDPSRPESEQERSDYLRDVADVVIGLRTRLVEAAFSGRGRRRGGPPDQDLLQGMTPEMLEAIKESNPDLADLMTGAAGPDMMNFQNPEYLLKQGQDSQVGWDRVVNGYVPWTIPDGLDDHVFGRLYEELESETLTDETIETARKSQHWQFLVKMLNTSAGPYSQVARLASHLYPTLGIDGGTYPSLLPAAAHFATSYFETSAGNTEDIAERIAQESPKGEHMNALLAAMKVAVVVEAEGGRKAKVELGVGRTLDILTGMRAGENLKNAAGEPLYQFTYPESHAQRGQVLSGTREEILSQVTGLRDIDVLQGLSPQWSKTEGRAAMGEALYSMTEQRRNEVFKSWAADDVVEQLRSQGIELSELTTIWATSADGQQLNDRNPLFVLRFKQLMANFSKQPDFATRQPEYEKMARAESWGKLVGDLAIVDFGKMHDLALASADIFGETWQWDPQQWFDHLSELWNKSIAGYAYNEKYTILPAAARKFVQSYLRGVLAWKRKDVDPVLIALNGNEKHSTAAWRNPLDATNADVIPPLRDLDGNPLTQALGGMHGEVTLPDGTKIDATSLKTSIDNTIMAVLYGKSDFRGHISYRMEQANMIMDLSAANPKWGEDAARSHLEYFVSQFSDGMAPQEFPSNQTESIHKLMALSDLRRSHLEVVDFKDLLDVMGYEKMDLDPSEYTGVRGLAKVIEVRSSEQWLVGQVEKFFKYLSKYPGLAAAETRALNKLVPTVNNALNPIYHKLMGGKADHFGGFQPDDVGEAIAKGVVNLILINQRGNEEAGKYVGQITEAITESASLIGYMSGHEQRQNTMDLVMAVDLFADNTMRMFEHNWVGGHGEHGSSRKYLQINTDDPEQEQAVVENLRKAGFKVVYPNGNELADYDLQKLADRGKIPQDLLSDEGTPAEVRARQIQLKKELKKLGMVVKRKPMVVWGGIQPVFAIKNGKVKDGKWEAPDSEVKVLGLYGHRGKEALMTIMCLEVLCDQMKITHHDMINTLAEVDTFRDSAQKAKKDPKEYVIEQWAKYQKTRDRLIEEHRATLTTTTHPAATP